MFLIEIIFYCENEQSMASNSSLIISCLFFLVNLASLLSAQVSFSYIRTGVMMALYIVKFMYNKIKYIYLTKHGRLIVNLVLADQHDEYIPSHTHAGIICNTPPHIFPPISPLHQLPHPVPAPDHGCTEVWLSTAGTSQS